MTTQSQGANETTRSMTNKRKEGSLSNNSVNSVFSPPKSELILQDSDIEEGRKKLSNIPPLKPQCDAFTQAIHNTGYNAFGITAIDVWLYNASDGHFEHAQNGWWRCHYFQPSSPAAVKALARVEDTSHTEYAPPTRQCPGAGLAGYFWEKCTFHDKHCLWVDVRAITSDPFQPPYLRTQVLEDAGFGKVTGVPFDVRGHKGVVLYFARETADEKQLKEECNDIHLRTGADLIGAISAATIASSHSVAAKGKRRDAAVRRARTKMLTMGKLLAISSRRNIVKEELPQSEEKPLKQNSSLSDIMKSKYAGFREWVETNSGDFDQILKEKVHLYLEKCRGGGLHPGPPMNTSQCCWTLSGCLITSVILAYIAYIINMKTGQDLVMGPFGALITLQFALVQAPVGQPRTAIYGQIISFLIVILVRVMGKFDLITGWFQPPLATSLAITSMAKLGVTHPPAGAAAWLYASMVSRNDLDFYLDFCWLLLGTGITCLMAMLCNNWSDKRQYPIFWSWRICS